jgi:class 3 adenylate cyclase
MASRDIVDFLNEHMTALTAVVKTHHGVLDKFVGDLLMTLFGAPVSRGSDALDGARSALGTIAERERVNLASRLYSLAKPGQVVIDDVTRERLGDRAEVRPLPPVKLKGFSTDIQAYELIALIDPPAFSPATP